MHYRLLGPLEVARGGRPVDIGPPKQRAVLAVLLLAQGRVVSTDRLVDAVWGDEVPGSSTASLQAYISNLRKALRADTGAASPVVRQAPGYYLDVSGSDDVDLSAFTEQCVAARAAIAEQRWRDALAAADTALASWRGPLLEDLRDQDWDCWPQPPGSTWTPWPIIWTRPPTSESWLSPTIVAVTRSPTACCESTCWPACPRFVASVCTPRLQRC